MNEIIFHLLFYSTNGTTQQLGILSKKLRLHLGLPCVYQGPKHSSRLLLLSPVCQLEPGSEVKQLGLGLMPMWDGDIMQQCNPMCCNVGPNHVSYFYCFLYNLVRKPIDRVDQACSLIGSPGKGESYKHPRQEVRAFYSHVCFGVQWEMATGM